MVLRHLEFLQHVDTTTMIKKMKDLTPSSSFAGFWYEGFGVKKLSAGESSSDESRKGQDHILRTDRTRHNCVPIQSIKRTIYLSFSTGPLELKFKDSVEKIDAVVWILQITLSKDHGGSSEGYQLIKLIKTKVKEAMKAMSHRAAEAPEGEQRDSEVRACKFEVADGRCRKRTGGRAKEMSVISVSNIKWYVIAYHVCPDN
jgi:hypothetical protein